MGVEAAGQPRWEQWLEEKLQGGEKSQRRTGQPAFTSNTCDEGSGIPGHLCSKKRETQLQEASPMHVWVYAWTKGPSDTADVSVLFKLHGENASV